MGFRTLEISEPSELHVDKGQLRIEQKDKTVSIPLEDLETVVCTGAQIRISTMAMIQMSRHGVGVMMMDEKYKPASVLYPVEACSHQALVLQRQADMDQGERDAIWSMIVRKKIENQARLLSLLGLEGADRLMQLSANSKVEVNDFAEATAAKAYFASFHPGLNRRVTAPINSQLNYGYAVVRNAMIKALITTGFQPTLGIHHHNQFNAFNLADDLIEPWRPMVDLLVYGSQYQSIILDKDERRRLALILHSACSIKGSKVSVMSGIGTMVQSFKHLLLNENDALNLPDILPFELIDTVTE
ncbi:MAG: type II CRISPR-associated endonuclease Cas1 [Clostridiales bacterium]|nr:type II CRISPR-associated endonuclease Cas1 [Clostridiales bacterium]